MGRITQQAGSFTLGISRPATEPKQFTVAVEKCSEKQTVGLSLQNVDDEQFLITSVNGGLVGDWNKAHPEFQVRVGDHVIGMNGCSGNTTKMGSIAKATGQLTMIVTRPC